MPLRKLRERIAFLIAPWLRTSVMEARSWRAWWDGVPKTTGNTAATWLDRF